MLWNIWRCTLDIIRAEREAKIAALESLVTDMSWEWRRDYVGYRHDRTYWANEIIKRLRDVEGEFEERWFEQREASAERVPF